MLFFSFFKTLIDHEVTVELKNDIQIRGVLKSVDQYLNIKLDNIQVLEEIKYPHMSAVKNVFIRGSVVRYVHLPANAVDVPLLEDATRRGTFHAWPMSIKGPSTFRLLLLLETNGVQRRRTRLGRGNE
jgi:U6 snRNA-associated Sm-like protein LSm2